MRNAERWLKLLLLLFGLPAAFAVVPFLMPTSWMAAVHQWIGMGVLPDKPIVDYLARYASGFSALYGFLLLLLLSRNDAVENHRWTQMHTDKASNTKTEGS